MEIWKDIKGYEGEYKVSNKGNVMSFVGKLPRMLKPRVNKRGYLRVSLHARNDKLIHRLVAEAFLDNPDNLPEVNHIDECVYNNNVDNLEWCTHKHNLNHGTCQQRARNKQSETFQLKNRKDLSKRVVCIDTGESFPSIQEAARFLSLHEICISKVCRGLRKTTGGLRFKYKETH